MTELPLWGRQMLKMGLEKDPNTIGIDEVSWCAAVPTPRFDIGTYDSGVFQEY